ncbi:radical SAM protein [Candidatus Woesearchaeota archaeon]|nr:radical SAM protein [Candidatus Woesearchaeota archaeon]
MKTTNFERAVFFSWHCNIRDCTYCYMSTQPKTSKTGKIARRSTESILAEVLITKKLGWDFGFFSGGVGAFSHTEFKELLEKVCIVWGEKIWINIGALSKEQIIDYKPFIKGVVGSIETVNEKIHDKVCPSKPAAPYYKMFEEAKKLGLKRAITIILGLGETIEDFEKLKDIIKKYGVTKIHFYGLNPQKGTIYENSKPPSAKYQAEWIKKTREEFSKIDIQMGIWEDRVDRVALLLEAGANSISKFPALKAFGKKSAIEIEKQAKKANRKFIGTLTKLPNIDWNVEVDKLDIDKELKEKVKAKLNQYLKNMKKS